MNQQEDKDMKKIVAMILLALLSLSLAACGGAAPAPAKEEAPQQATQAETPAEPAAEPEAPAAEPEAPAEESPEEEPLSKEEIIARVIEMKGRPVEDLIDWLGEPERREYSSSCLIDGGQDGQLYYDGFTVYTLVQPDGTETVDFCE